MIWIGIAIGVMYVVVVLFGGIAFAISLYMERRK